jgi:type VI secretion system protein ImpJ
MNCELDEAGGRDDTRYVAETRSIPDENTGLDEKPVRVGRKNIRILLDTEEAKDLLTLPVARVMRDGSGNLVYDKRFIPPCVQVGASETLLLMARRLIEILEEKSAVLAVPGKGKKGFQGGLSAQEIARFWFLHAINSSLAPLRQFFFSKRGHPEELFVELSRLAGALCTFGMDSHPRTLPLYNHLALDKCFEDLDRHIRTHLEIIIPTNCVTIPLQPAADYYFEGEITDLRCLDRSNWIFAIHSPIGDADVVARTVQLVKVCSAQFVPELVRRALPGMTLTHMPVPPSAVSPRVEYQYFGVSKAGPCWDHINQTRRVGVYVPGDLPSPEIELLVVLES